MLFHPDRRALLAGAAALLALPARAAPTRLQRLRLILLGTGGGPTPKPNRSAPANVIIAGGRAYVIDCGNGVARQLVLAGVPLASLAAVLITHQHSDHNADYGNLLWLAWSATLAHPVQTFGPPPLTQMTAQFLALNDTDIATRIADEGRPPLAPLIVPHDVTRDGLVFDDGSVRVTCAHVNHPPLPSLAYRFDSADRSIVVSGDTTPSDALVALANGADVLVHEAMFPAAMEALIASEPDATRLRAHLFAAHTAVADVGRIATRAGVGTLVLSHFVPGGLPGVADVDWLAAARSTFAGRIIVGRDLLEV